MYVTRAAFTPARATKAYALDLEFVKYGGHVYARSAAFVPFCRASQEVTQSDACIKGSAIHHENSTLHAAHPLPSLTKLLERPTVLELKPEVTLTLAEPLPCGHLLRGMIDSRFAPTPGLTAVLEKMQHEASDALSSYRELRTSLRQMRKAEKQKNKRALNKTQTGETEGSAEAAARKVGDEEDAEDEGGDASEGDALMSAGPTSSAEGMVMRSLQMRHGVVHHFRGFDPHGIPNVRRFNKDALELLHAAPVDSRDFKQACLHLRPLRVAGRGKGGYKGLSFCARTHPHFTQEVLRTVFESPAAWYAWLTECHAAVEANLHAVRDAHCAGTHGMAGSFCIPQGGEPDNSAVRQPTQRAVDFIECGSVEELGTRMSEVWASLLRETDRESSPSPSGVLEHRHATCFSFPAKTQPPKVFVYGNVDLSVIHQTLGLCTPPLRLNLSERGYKAGRFFRSSSKAAERDGGGSTTASAVSEVLSSEEAADRSPSLLSSTKEGCHGGALPPTRLASPYEARVVDLTKHPLFTAAGFAESPKRTPSLGAAFTKAAKRDATAAAVNAVPQPHDPLWDAQALACLCAVAGAVR